MATCRTRLPLLPRQALIWLGQQRHAGVPLYNMAMVFRIDGALDAGRFKQAFHQLVAGEDALRFYVDCDERDGAPCARFHPTVDTDLEIVDLCDRPDAEADCRRRCDELARTYIDPRRGCYRSVLFKVSETHWTFAHVQHHIATDVTSFGLLFQRLQTHYQDSESTQPVSAYPSFAAYIDAGVAADPDVSAADSSPPVDIAFAAQPTPAESQQALAPPTVSERIEIALSVSEYGALCRHADALAALSRHGAIFALLALTLQIIATRIRPGESFALAMPLHNRGTRRERQQSGLLIDLAWIDAPFDDNDSAADACRRILRAATQALRQQTSAGDTLATNSAQSVVCNVIAQRFSATFAGLPCETRWLHCGHQDPNHALRLHAYDFHGDGSLTLAVDILHNRFDAACRAAIPGALHAVIRQISADIEQPAKTMGLLAAAAAPAWIQTLTGPARAGPSRPIIERLAQQADDTPRAMAIVDGEQTWDYAHLCHAIASSAERILAVCGERPTHVAVCLPRGIALVLGAYAAFATGATLVPIDAGFPSRRCRQIIASLADAGARSLAVVTDRDDLELAPGIQQIYAGELLSSAERNGGARSVRLRAAPVAAESIAYIMFTSGSSGAPKGVAISHRAINNYLRFAARRYALDEPLRMPLFTSIGFDLTLTSLLLPLTSGGELHIYPQQSRQVDTAVLDVFSDNRINTVKLTPSHLNLVDDERLRASHVQRFIVGGEALHRDQAARAALLVDGCREVVNEYGPTEATIGCLVHAYDADADRDATLPIGRPIDNMQALVVDTCGQPLPAGIRGELWLGGDGLAHGYLNDQPLTAAAFVAPGGDWGARRYYRTGDIASATPSGAILYHGRNDQQLKVRGIRVEAAEIESILKGVDGVRDAVVAMVTSAEPVDGTRGEAIYCLRCGLPANYPGIAFDDDGVCSLCRRYDDNQNRVAAYFKTEHALTELVARIKNRGSREGGAPSPARWADSIALYSGGKDSTYMLYRLCELGLAPWVLTLDNGYISDYAKENIESVVADLGLAHRYVTTPHMAEIFSDSLARHSNVCNGCFKTIYTLALQLADQHSLGHVFTGLSRGQLFETRLHDLYDQTHIEVPAFDHYIDQARRAYHGLDDAVNRCLGRRVIDDDILARVEFVDFYRYVDVSLDTVMTYLDEQTPWQRPPDTGRSTNCLINEAGIFVHKKERGFHNYALAYSWDVRIGHKRRDQALEELDDHIDPKTVARILDEIDYRPDARVPTGAQSPGVTAPKDLLTAWITTNASYDESELRNVMATELPRALIPTHIVHVEQIPLTANGKADIARLQKQSTGVAKSLAVAPVGAAESRVLAVWRQVFDDCSIGVTDDFFSLGGDSLTAVKLSQQLTTAGYRLDPAQLFAYANVRTLADHLERSATRAADGDEAATVDVMVDLSAEELADIGGELGERGLGRAD